MSLPVDLSWGDGGAEGLDEREEKSMTEGKVDDEL